MQEASLLQGGEPVERSSPCVSFQELFGLADGDPYVSMTDTLSDALTAIGVSDGARETLRCYYRYARMSVLHGQVTEEGDIRVWPRQEKVARFRGITVRQLRRHMDELEKLELVRREVTPRGLTNNVYLKPMGKLLRELLERPGVRERMRELNPDAHDEKVVSIEALQADRNVPMQEDKNVRLMKMETERKRKETTPSAGAGEDEAQFVDWMDEQMDRTKVLFEAMRSARAQNEVAREKKAAKKPHEKMGGGRKRESSLAPEDRASALAEYLRNRIKSGLESVYQPTITEKDLKHLKDLRNELGGDTLRKVIDFITEPDRWARVRRECRINTRVPTPGVLYGFRATIVPMALQGDQPEAPRRSGHARTEASAADDILGSF